MNNREKLLRSRLQVGCRYHVRTGGKDLVVRIERIHLGDERNGRPGRGSLQIDAVDVSTGERCLFWSVRKFLGPAEGLYLRGDV